MRPFSSAIFLSSVLILSAAPQTPAAGAGGRKGPWAVCLAGGARPGRPRAFWPPAGHEVSQERVQAVECPGTLGHQVNKRLSESRRSTSEAASGSIAASLSLREAAKAVARASTPSFLRALPAKLESTRTRAESLGCSRPPPTRLRPPTSPPGDDPGRWRSLRPNAVRGTFLPSVLGLSGLL
jgi:hypothetical protein